MLDGGVVTLRRHGNPNGPRLVLSHGNGLAVGLYYPFWPTFNFAEFLNMDYEFVPGTTHFLQMEKPEECVARIRACMGPIIGGWRAVS